MKINRSIEYTEVEKRLKENLKLFLFLITLKT